MARRLYDIANALTCLKLTAKTHVDRKPAFIWKGAAGLDAITLGIGTITEVKEENDENLCPDPVKGEEPTNEEIVARVFN